MAKRNPRFNVIADKLNSMPALAVIIAAVPDATPESISAATSEIVAWMNLDVAGNDAPLTGAELYELVDTRERSKLSPLDKTEINILLSLSGSISFSDVSVAGQKMASLFAANSVTSKALAAKTATMTKNYRKHGLPSPHFHDIEIALTPESI